MTAGRPDGESPPQGGGRSAVMGRHGSSACLRGRVACGEVGCSRGGTRDAIGRLPDVCVPLCSLGRARWWLRGRGRSEGGLHAVLMGDRICACASCDRVPPDRVPARPLWHPRAASISVSRPTISMSGAIDDVPAAAIAPGVRRRGATRICPSACGVRTTHGGGKSFCRRRDRRGLRRSSSARHAVFAGSCTVRCRRRASAGRVRDACLWRAGWFDSCCCCSRAGRRSRGRRRHR